jgi:two-component system nitrogen regulation response regulator NtrX
MAFRILIIDDEIRVRTSLRDLLRDEGYDVTACESGEEGIANLQNHPSDMILLDVMLPGMDGIETLKKIREILPDAAVIMMSGQADLSVAVQATKFGAHNFYEKPLNPDQLLLELSHIVRQKTLEERLASLESLVGASAEIIGDSTAMRKLKTTIAKTAPTDGRVLILGENGSGKELVARAIHRQSGRADRPFISLNCAAIPENLVESELFGHEKGAFTGADKAKPGRFELANGGTLFLDEIGDMNLDTQAKLLRVLQEREAIRLGGTKTYAFDVRIIAATNKHLEEAIAAGRFREDLYYRLNVVPITVPPLRDRLEDIPLLATHFLNTICKQTGNGMKQWGSGCMPVLQAYPWLGNVRELSNFTERMVILSTHQTIDSDEVFSALPLQTMRIPNNQPTVQNSERSFREQIMDFEKHLLLTTFQEVDGNVSEMARRMQIDRANLHRKLKIHGIK